MKRSGAWKNLERESARMLGGNRVTRGADFSVSDVDVKIPELPFLKVDAKYRKSHAHHSLLEEVRKKYCNAGDIPVLITKHHRQRGANVTIPLELFAVLLDAFRQQNEDPDVRIAVEAKLAYARGAPDEIEGLDPEIQHSQRLARRTARQRRDDNCGESSCAVCG